MPAIIKKPLEIPFNAPYLPPRKSVLVIYALQAMAQGKADADQQTRALEWLLNECCKASDMSYRPGDGRDDAFAEGKKYVAHHLARIISMTPQQIAELKVIEDASDKVNRSDSEFPDH
jgi:hypothetical protein